MRVRIHMFSGDTMDAEEFSPDDGVTWVSIGADDVLFVMRNGDAGYIVVRDAFTAQWRALRHGAIESIGPAPDLNAAVDAEAERRIQRIVSSQLPARVAAEAPVIERPNRRVRPPRQPRERQ